MEARLHPNTMSPVILEHDALHEGGHGEGCEYQHEPHPKYVDVPQVHIHCVRGGKLTTNTLPISYTNVQVNKPQGPERKCGNCKSLLINGEYNNQ